LVGRDHGASNASNSENLGDASEQPCLAERYVMLLATRTESSTALPEQTTCVVESRPRVAVLQDRQLLLKSQVLGSKAWSSTRRRKQCADEDSKPFAHCRKASRKWWNKAIESMRTNV
jgi:hypothetical protein